MSTEIANTARCTLLSAVRLWLEDERPEGHNTRRAYKAALKSYAAYYADEHGISVDAVPLSGITKNSVIDYQKHCQLQGHANTTINARVSAIQAFVSYCCERTPGAINPLKKLKRLPTNKPEFEGVDPSVIFHVIDALKHERVWKSRHAELKHWRLLLSIQLMLFYGLRVGAVSNMRLKDVNLETRKMRLYSKGGSNFVRTINDEVFQTFKTYMTIREQFPGEAVIVSTTGSTMTPRMIRRDLETACRVLHVEYFNPHKLRHTFARKFYETTKDLHGTAQLLEHKDVNVTKLYTTKPLKELEEEADGLWGEYA